MLALLTLITRPGAADTGVAHGTDAPRRVEDGDGRVASNALPVVPWRSLDTATYRAGLDDGTLSPGMVVDQPLRQGVPTMLFIHGAAGAPNQFAALASFFADRANTAAFLYDDSARLVESTDLLRRELLRFSGRLLARTR